MAIGYSARPRSFFQYRLDLVRAEDGDFGRGDPRRINQLGDVLPDQAPLRRMAEGPMQHPMHMEDRPRRKARVAGQLRV